MSTGPEQPQGPQWDPQNPASGWGQGGWPAQARNGWPAQGQNGWPAPGQNGSPGQAQAQEQYAWQPQPQAQAQPYQWSPASPVQQPVIMPKNPAVSLLVSFFIPGLGSLISGNASTGTIILVLWLAGVLLSIFIIGIPVAFGAWIWGMIDGYRSAQDWNRAHGILS